MFKKKKVFVVFIFQNLSFLLDIGWLYYEKNALLAHKLCKNEF